MRHARPSRRSLPRYIRRVALVCAVLLAAALPWVGCGGGVPDTDAISAANSSGSTGTGGEGGMSSTSHGSGGVACGPGTTLCGAVCVDTKVDPSHCGSCDSACATGESCVEGKCAVACAGGSTLCGDKCVDTAN